MRNRDRILAKVDELQGYMKELRQIEPASFEEYAASIEKRRSVERLLQISVECVLDICSLVTSALKLGLPSCEEDLLEKVESAAIFQPETMRKVKGMRAFRNIFVHKYGRIDDHIVFSVIKEQLTDFDTIIRETVRILNNR